MDARELELIRIAERGSDEESSAAMKELREKYDATYGWCSDCDGLVCKEIDCCLNQPISNETPEF